MLKHSSDNDVLVSVIVPIYNVERFLRRCVESLARQTLSQIEVIFVDDASPDNCLGILDELLSKDSNLRGKSRIISHRENLGLPSARNSGLQVSKGRYIYHCDADDFVDEELLYDMYHYAENHDADIVWCDWFLSYNHKERYMRQPNYESCDEVVKAMLSGAMKYNVWNKLVRRCLYFDNGIFFPDGYGMGEDMTMIKLFAVAKRVRYLPKAYYHYVKENSAAFSKTYSEKHILELKHNADQLIAFIRAHYRGEYEPFVSFFKLETKFPLLLINDNNRRKTWCEWYPEANTYICRNNYISARSRSVQWLAFHNHWLLVSLYSSVLQIVNKIISR